MSNAKHSAQLSSLTMNPKAAFGMAFALFSSVGFGVTLCIAAALNWDRLCDMPLRIFLVAFGGLAVLAAFVFFILQVAHGSPNEEQSFVSRVLTHVMLLLCVAFGGAGCAFYWGTRDCQYLATVSHRWTFAGILVFLILFGLLLSAVTGKFGAPVFAKIGFVFSSLFQFMANMCNSAAAYLSAPPDPQNNPPVRGPAGDFAIVLNHAMVIWIFVYILTQVIAEWHLPCDMPLHTELSIFAVYGMTLVYFHFLYEKFAGVKTRQRLQGSLKYLRALTGAGFLAWAVTTVVSVLTSKTCKEKCHNVYRMSLILAFAMILACGLAVGGACLAGVAYLFSGKLRFVIVMETGDRRRYDDDEINLDTDDDDDM
eukprot:c7982_g1_i2.p1 GENE.c7982_g1_i2~~c7982_g1_i2.p1  ORF type:complete len:368 (-),score=54.74 c7982_g1_i2:68-1171(-)